MPAATQAPPATTPSAVPQPPKPGPTAIPIGAMPQPPTTAPAETGKIDPFSGFDKYAKPVEEGLTQPGAKTSAKPAEPAKTEEPKSDESKIEGEGEDELGEPAEQQPEIKTESKVDEKVDVKDAKQPSLGKLYRTEKSLREKAEAEVLRLKTLIPNEAEARIQQDRIKQVESQNKELLEHIRHLDYQKHPEFQEKYEKPYNEKWGSIMRRLSGVMVKDSEGNTRAVQPADIVRLGTLPADQVIEQAEAQFGKLGNWVAERVEELKSLQEAKFLALDNAKKDATKLAEEWENQSNDIKKFLIETYEKSISEIEQHSKYGKFFKPIEGDDAFNTKLEAGTKFVDENWRKDPRDPSLTPEQRAKIVKAHAAIRNRARAFSVQNLTIERQQAEIDRLTAELAQFKSSEPKIEGQRMEQPNGAPSDPMQSIFQGIEKYARPGVV